jgi:ribosomal protein S17E
VGELILETYLEECQADFQDGKGKVQSVVEAVRLLRR